MNVFKVLMPIALSLTEGKESYPVIRKSKTTQKPLWQVTDGPSLNYQFTTQLEIAEDGTEQRFLIGEFELIDVGTNYLKSPTATNQHEIRVSVGWRNPQEDAYDVTSINFKYHETASEVKCEAVDGYAVGSIDSHFYNWEWVSGKLISA